MHLVHALTRLARTGAAPHVVVGSSTLVYGARADNPSFLSEDAPLAGRRDYPLIAEKIDAERQLERLHACEGIAVTVVRAAPILWPGARTLAGTDRFTETRQEYVMDCPNSFWECDHWKWVRHTSSFTQPFEMAIPEITDGNWTLKMDIVPGDNKLSGTATIVFASGEDCS